MIAMRRLFLASRIKLYAALQTVFVGALAVSLFVSTEGKIAPLILFALSILATVIYLYGMRGPLHCISEIKRVIQEMHEGEFGSRITRVPWTGELGQVAWDMNESLDQMEAYFRELNTCFYLVSGGYYHRFPFAEGMKGEFGTSLGLITQSLRAMEENAQLIKRNEMASELQELNATQIMNNLQLSQTDLININEVMGQVGEIATENVQLAESSQSSISQVVEAQQQSMEMITNNTRAVEKLNEMSSEISGVLNMIRDIADQTNLLALNASIEAARAGEHGRGFAVVADEVKNLASHTKNATDEISEVVSGFQNETSKMHKSSSDMTQMAERVQTTVEKVRGGFIEFAERAELTLDSVDRAGNTCFGSLVKVDHMIYKQKAYKLFSSGIDIPEAIDVGVDSHSCRLGKWYEEGAGKQHFSTSRSYPKLKEPHDEVHNVAHQLLGELKNDWHQDEDTRQTVLALYQNMELASDGLMGIVDKLVVEQAG
ncbi:MAG: methyl-accepting chemotaxis protein [Pseudomonadales bacterium]|nr:methyl-accepting chemotaxis protein [Pseudomonadales bacterium]